MDIQLNSSILPSANGSGGGLIMHVAYVAIEFGIPSCGIVYRPCTVILAWPI